MPNKILPFGEFLPDQPQFANPGSAYIQNAIPRTKGSYGPMATPSPYAGALPTGPVCGSYSYEGGDGTIYNFAGSKQHLYLQKTGAVPFSDVSGPSAPYTTEKFWSFTSFGKRVIATNFDNNIQTYLTGTDSAFSDLSASAPRARYCAVIRDFLMVANTYDVIDGAVPYRVWWPAIGDPTNWPAPGTDPAIQVESDFQDLQQTDLGTITGIVGGHLSAADGAVLCQRGIYRVAYAGSPAIFDFAVAQGSQGTEAPLSIVTRRLTQPGSAASAVIYYYGSDGFAAFDGSASVGIGAQKVDSYFHNDLDPGHYRDVQGVYDPTHKLVMWFYHGAGNNGFFNRLLLFNWELNQWAPVDLSATPVAWAAGEMATTQGYTLDELDPFGDLEHLAFSFDDPVWAGGVPNLAWFDSSGVQNFINGPSMAATVETGEQQLFPGRRARITNTRPIADSVVPVSINIGAREKTRDAIVYTAAVPENILGDCPQRSTGRYTRFRMIVPAAAGFKHLQGIDVSAIQEGIR